MERKIVLVAHGSLLGFCLCLTHLGMTVQKQYAGHLTLEWMSKWLQVHYIYDENLEFLVFVAF